MPWRIEHELVHSLDDIIIFSQDAPSHIERLEAVFQKLAKAGLKLKPSMCEFLKKRIKYLGHIVSEEGVSTDTQKVEAVLNWPVPKTVYDVKSLSRHCGVLQEIYLRLQ